MKRRLLLLALLPLAAGAATPLEINEASQAQLESLSGVGPDLAERILKAREAKLFDNWGDLRRRVRGIGPKLATALSNQGLRVQGLAFER